MALRPEQLESLRVALEALDRELEAALASTSEAARPVALDQAAIGRVSRIDAIQQQKMIEANRLAQQARRQRVRAALHRLADGSYGDCLACGEAIAPSRLEARPESPLCVACQTERER